MNIYDEHRNHNHRFFECINLLKKIASSSDIYYKHAAALIDGDRIYSAGVNQFVKTVQIKLKDSNEIQTHFRTIHAEISVFSKIPKKTAKGLDILVIRINKNFALKNSRPCNHCIDKLKKIGIRKVFYSNEDGNIVSEFIHDMEKLHVSDGNKFLQRLHECISMTVL
jgi:deoxycytidylate deaminase